MGSRTRVVKIGQRLKCPVVGLMFFHTPDNNYVISFMHSNKMMIQLHIQIQNACSK